MAERCTQRCARTAQRCAATAFRRAGVDSEPVGRELFRSRPSRSASQAACAIMLGLSLPEREVGHDGATGIVYERKKQSLSERHLDTLDSPPATLQASVTPEVADASTPDAEDAADASKAANAALKEGATTCGGAQEAAQVKDLARLLHAGQHLRVAGVDEPPEMLPPPPSAERVAEAEQLSDAAAALERGASDLRRGSSASASYRRRWPAAQLAASTCTA